MIELDSAAAVVLVLKFGKIGDEVPKLMCCIFDKSPLIYNAPPANHLHDNMQLRPHHTLPLGLIGRL